MAKKKGMVPKHLLKTYVSAIINAFDFPEREGLRDTPERYIKFLEDFCNPPEFNFTMFDCDGIDEMIVQRDIPFYSLCEHHLLPFHGVGHIAYVPDKKIVGLSKLARCLEYHSRAFQNQERITQQVAAQIMTAIKPRGVAVVLTAEHLCMSMRGVRKPGARTTTSALLGVFEKGEARNEFLNLIR